MKSLQCTLRLRGESASAFRVAIGAMICALACSVTLPSLAKDVADPLHPKVPWSGEWTESRVVNSIVRIVSQFCHYGMCPDVDDHRNSRVGTGFVAEIGDLGKVIVTALHNIAGANRVTYQFTTHENSVPRETHALTISMDDDVALLELKDADASRVSALRLVSASEQREKLTEKDLAIVSYGHSLSSMPLDSDFGNLKSQSPNVLRELFDITGGKVVADEIERAGYPSLNMPVIGLEDALLPGDSGAPVLPYLEPVVIGMAHGGVPVSGNEIAWMLPAERISRIVDLNVDSSRLPAFGLKDVRYSIRLFFLWTGNEIYCNRANTRCTFRD